jgi:nucleoside-diphosphate-sugar epimerase
MLSRFDSAVNIVECPREANSHSYSPGWVFRLEVAAVKVLVTGATGPFGRAVCRRLVKAGHTVSAAARRRPAELPGGIEFAATDIRDFAAVQRAMEGCAAVIHLAWVVSPLQSENETAEINLGGTQNVIDAMNATGCDRLVFSSSVLAYGAVPGHPPRLREDDVRRPEPQHLYAFHKKAAEDAIMVAVPDAVIVRAGIIAGRDVDNTVFRFFSSPMLPIPDPMRVQQFVHTDDVARFTADAVSASGRGPVNITGGGELTMQEIADILGRRLIQVPENVLRRGVSAAWRFQLAELAPAEVGALLYMPIVDTTRLREEWQFSCAWSSREALADMARAAHGKVTLGKKTVRLPWRVPAGSKPAVGRAGRILLRQTFAAEVDRVAADLYAVLEESTQGDEEQHAAQRQLVSDLTEHAELLATIGEREGYPAPVNARAKTAVSAGRRSENS